MIKKNVENFCQKKHIKLIKKKTVLSITLDKTLLSLTRKSGNITSKLRENTNK